MGRNSLNHLLDVLCDHDVPFDRDAIKAAFDDPDSQTAIQAWVEEYLGPETLLTKDEASLYAALSKTGEAEILATSHDLSLVRGLDEQEIKDAIEELKRSTAAIENQSEALRLQQNAMNMLVTSNTRTTKARAQADKNLNRIWELENAHINTVVEELSHSLAYQVSDFEQQCKASEASIKQTVESILRSDDKLLTSLQKLASDLDPGAVEDDGDISRLRELCARLIKHTVEGVRTRLDRIYLDTFNNAVNSKIDVDSENLEIADLKEELESLYSEILPVAQMSAEQQYLKPALREIAARDGQGQERSAKAIKYINDCLIFLVNRTGTILERVEEHQCHQAALQYVIDTTKRELQLTASPSPTIVTKPVQTRRRSSGSQSHVRLRTTRRRSSTQLDEDIEPEQQLLRNLGISLPSEGTSDQERVEILERALSDRLGKLEGHLTNLHSTTESSISDHLQDARATLQLLQDSLLTESLYHKVQFLEPEIDSSIATFEEDLQELQKTLEAVNLRKLQVRNVHREKLVERWARREEGY